jgi:hypothetical protein
MRITEQAAVASTIQARIRARIIGKIAIATSLKTG